MSAVPVFSRDAAYVAAAAELPIAVRIGDGPEGAIVIVPAGAGIRDAAVRAERDGARALVIPDARAASVADLAALRDELSVPVVFARSRVRPDVASGVGAASGATRAVVVESIGAAAERTEVLRDAVAWARLLAGGDLAVVSCSSTPTGVIALLERLRSADGPLSVTLLHSTARAGTAVIRAHTVGHERTDVTVDDGALIQRVERIDADGERVLPPRFEAAARVALRRAIAAIEGGGTPDDLAEYAHDATVVGQIIASAVPTRTP